MTEPTPTPTLPSAIAPEDRELANEIIAMDPSGDVASPVQDSGSQWRGAFQMKASGLPPELRKEVESQLEGVPFDKRPERENALVAEVLKRRGAATRLRTGNGPDALPYHQEGVTIARQYESLQNERNRLAMELLDVSGHRSVTDPATGQLVPEAIPAVSGERRRQMAARIDELQYQMGLLRTPEGTNGIEAQRRMDKALVESVALRRRAQEQAAEALEVRVRAEQINRERRINAQAEQLASFQRNEVQ